jgi:hypothetical protein
MHGASMQGQIEAGGDMNRHRDGFQRVGYREVTTCINESGTRVQTWRSKRRGNRNQRKVVSELLLLKPGGMCYRHNLAKPEGGPRTRWA